MYLKILLRKSAIFGVFFQSRLQFEWRGFSVQILKLRLSPTTPWETYYSAEEPRSASHP